MTLDRLSEASWRVRLSQSRPGLAHLALTDHRAEVTHESLDTAVEMARMLGATEVRTSALFGESGPTLAAAGFVDVDRFVVLQRDLDLAGEDGTAIGDGSATTGSGRIRLHRVRRQSLGAAARVDAAAFGELWATDRDGLAEAVAATPSSWGRYATIGWRRTMIGFVLCGASGRDAYIQRLAVHPTAQRQHVASTLMAGALGWMSSRGSTKVLVNTRPDNLAALALYERWGFRLTQRSLIVAERTL